MSTVRDRLWLWGAEGGCHNELWKLPKPSRMTPAEGAYYMGIPNVMMVRNVNLPPASMFDQYAKSLSSLGRVVWSIIGDAGSVSNDRKTDLGSVMALAKKYRNIEGAMMDDFFPMPQPGKPVARYRPADVARFRRTLRGAARPLDLYVVIYEHNLNSPVEKHLAECDVVTYWTWMLANVRRLEANFRRVSDLAPGKRKMLGLYLWAYGDHKPMPLDLVKFQCGLARKWLHSGAIEGIILCSNCVCDLNLDAVEWVRRWIQRVGDEKVAPAGKARRT